MDHLLAAMIVGCIAMAQLSFAGAQQIVRISGPTHTLRSESAQGDLTGLPPAPKGTSTIIGGEIQNVDPVRDELTLKVFGQRPVTLLFDERTQVYLDGKRIALRSLRAGNHGSVQTVLDGTNVFALSIHMLSLLPQGDFQGQVENYNPETNELTVSAAMSGKPITLIVPITTPVVREGQGASSSLHPELSSLVKGTLISVKFQADNRGRGVANQIAILATPGSAYIFSGILSSFDMHTGLLVLLDPRDGKSYEVTFDPGRPPTTESLHKGDSVRVATIFDGAHYVASLISSN